MSDNEVNNMNNACDEIVEFLIASYENDDGIHAETILGAAAAITGEQLLRSCVDPEQLNEGSWIISDEVNKLLFENTFENPEEHTVYSQICGAAMQVDIEPEDLPDMDAIIKHINENMSSTFPRLTIPEKSYPQEWSPNAAVRYRNKIEEIFQKHNIPEDIKCLVCTLVTAEIMMTTISMYEDPKIAPQLAMEIIAVVSKMIPLKQEM